MTRDVIALDPGTTQTGWCILSGRRVIDSGVHVNDAVLKLVQEYSRLPASSRPSLAIEMVASYGMAVGREVFETVRWIGRFQQAWAEPEQVRLVYRQQVKLTLCNSPRAKDPNVRQALIDMLGAPGNKRAPGATYGVKSHAWAALAVAVVASMGSTIAPPQPGVGRVEEGGAMP